MISLSKLLIATVSLAASLCSPGAGAVVGTGAAVGTAVGCGVMAVSGAVVESGAMAVGAVVGGAVVATVTLVGSAVASSPQAIATSNRTSSGANSAYLPFRIVRYDKEAPPMENISSLAKNSEEFTICPIDLSIRNTWTGFLLKDIDSSPTAQNDIFPENGERPCGFGGRSDGIGGRNNPSTGRSRRTVPQPSSRLSYRGMVQEAQERLGNV